MTEMSRLCIRIAGMLRGDCEMNSLKKPDETARCRHNMYIAKSDCLPAGRAVKSTALVLG